MKLDCCNLECPKPVLKVKKALEKIRDGELEVVVNSEASRQNVKKYAKSKGCSVIEREQNGKIILSILKGFECQLPQNTGKVIFLKDNKIGKGKLGKKLMIGFLSSILELDSLPKKIICVNKAVYLATKNKQSIKILKKLEKKGVKVYSCGACLDFFNLHEALEVGKVGNAYDTVESLMKSEGVISL